MDQGQVITTRVPKLDCHYFAVMGDPDGTQATARYTSLDGLRGVAALVVLIHHCLLVSPELADAVDGDGSALVDAWVWWVTFTPLHLFWAGHEAVYVFFILSGFVLTLPFVRKHRTSWLAYYPKRMIRIYLPVWGSLVFALIMASMIPRAAASELSSWVNLHDEPAEVMSDAFLLQGTGLLNSPLWSLQYEMLFSLLLPLYLIALIRFKKFWLFPLIGLVTLIAAGNILYLALPVYMPMFGIGVLMAVHRESLESWGRGLGGWMWAGLLVVSIILLCSRWIFPQLPVVISMAAVGAALLIFAVIAWQPMKSFGDNPLIRWLGLRSFSLYLIHEPIVLSVTFALRSNDAVQVALLAVPLSLLVTELFFRFAERPSHRLASAAGKLLSSGLVSRKPASASVS